MTYQSFVQELFIEDQTSKGLDEQEAIDIFEDAEFSRIETWLGKQGYDLDVMYRD